MRKKSLSDYSQFYLDERAIAAVLDELTRLVGATQKARLAAQTEADRTHDRRLAGAIRTDDYVQVWPWVKLHGIVCTVKK